MGNVTMTLYTTAPGQQAIMAGPFELPRTGRTGRLPEAAFEVRPANSRAQVQFTAEVTVQVSLKVAIRVTPRFSLRIGPRISSAITQQV